MIRIFQPEYIYIFLRFIVWQAPAQRAALRRSPRCVGLIMEKLRGYDRRPTEEEALAPPDQRPWTEYDGRGDKQLKPPFKALGVGPCLCFGPTCCVLELQWPEWLCNRPSFEPGDCDGWDGCFEVRCSQWLTRLQIG